MLGDERDIRERGCAEIRQEARGGACSLLSLPPHGKFVEIIQLCLGKGCGVKG